VYSDVLAGGNAGEGSEKRAEYFTGSREGKEGREEIFADFRAEPSRFGSRRIDLPVKFPDPDFALPSTRAICALSSGRTRVFVSA
jgi:hypothetical protein